MTSTFPVALQDAWTSDRIPYGSSRSTVLDWTITTIGHNTSVHTKPWRPAPIATKIAKAGTDLGCTGGPGWFRVSQNGRWLGYVRSIFVDTTAG